MESDLQLVNIILVFLLDSEKMNHIHNMDISISMRNHNQRAVADSSKNMLKLNNQ
jgi:hypothetical protein